MTTKALCLILGSLLGTSFAAGGSFQQLKTEGLVTSYQVVDTADFNHTIETAARAKESWVRDPMITQQRSAVSRTFDFGNSFRVPASQPVTRGQGSLKVDR